MNEQPKPIKKKFAVGHFFGNDNSMFQNVTGRYLDHIQEIFFSWPELKNARGLRGDPDTLKEKHTLLASDVQELVSRYFEHWEQV